MNASVTSGGIVAPASALARNTAVLAELIMDASETERFAVEKIGQCVPLTASLITDAIAAFDADPGASRRYLMQASAILQACTAHESERIRRARSTRGLAHWQLTRILEYIEQHLADTITGKDLAGLVGVSNGQLFRAFKASVGIPPLRYVVSRRLELVCLLLRDTQEPLCQIAVTAGFCDQSHLCRVFRRALGVTPVAWRRENAVGPKNSTRERSMREIEGHRACDAYRSWQQRRPRRANQRLDLRQTTVKRTVKSILRVATLNINTQVCSRSTQRSS